jgi:hypothetical protein
MNQKSLTVSVCHEHLDAVLKGELLAVIRNVDGVGVLEVLADDQIVVIFAMSHLRHGVTLSESNVLARQLTTGTDCTQKCENDCEFHF